MEYLRRSLAASQGDITLVTIGPLTNVGVLLCKHPEVKGKIKEIVMMGGAYYMHYNEWTFSATLKQPISSIPPVYPSGP